MRQREGKAGGIGASRSSTRFSRRPTLTAWVCPVSHNLNFSNRPVRTRLPWWCGRGPVREGRPYPDFPK